MLRGERDQQIADLKAKTQRLEKKIHDQRTEWKNRMIQLNQELAYQKYAGQKLGLVVSNNAGQFGRTQLHMGIDALKSQRDEALAVNASLTADIAQLKEEKQSYRDIADSLTADLDQVKECEELACTARDYWKAERDQLITGLRKLRKRVASEIDEFHNIAWNSALHRVISLIDKLLPVEPSAVSISSADQEQGARLSEPSSVLDNGGSKEGES